MTRVFFKKPTTGHPEWIALQGLIDDRPDRNKNAWPTIRIPASNLSGCRKLQGVVLIPAAKCVCEVSTEIRHCSYQHFSLPPAKCREAIVDFTQVESMLAPDFARRRMRATATPNANKPSGDSEPLPQLDLPENGLTSEQTSGSFAGA